MAETGYGPGVGTGHGAGSAASPATDLPLVDLRNLASYRGQQVQVGGLVSQVSGSVVSLDDGTASGRLIIQGEAAPYLDLIEVGDPIEVAGLVEADATGPFLLVTDPEGVIQTGDPGGGRPGQSGPRAMPPPRRPESPGRSPRASPAGASAPRIPRCRRSGRSTGRGLDSIHSGCLPPASSAPPWRWLA